MKLQFKFLVFILTIFSCTTVIKPENCMELDKIEVFGIGSKTINFPIRQSEKDVRMNQLSIITDSVRLKKIEHLIIELESCMEEDRELGSIMLVGDFYCKDGGKYTLIYDRFLTKINSSFYCEDSVLINELRAQTSATIEENE